MQFHETVQGKRFFEGTLPHLIKATLLLTAKHFSKQIYFLVTVPKGTVAIEPALYGQGVTISSQPSLV